MLIMALSSKSSESLRWNVSDIDTELLSASVAPRAQRSIQIEHALARVTHHAHFPQPLRGREIL